MDGQTRTATGTCVAIVFVFVLAWCRAVTRAFLQRFHLKAESMSSTRLNDLMSSSVFIRFFVFVLDTVPTTCGIETIQNKSRRESKLL